MKTKDLRTGATYKSSKNPENTYTFCYKLYGKEYVFTQFENGEYVDVVRLNSKEVSYLFTPSPVSELILKKANQGSIIVQQLEQGKRLTKSDLAYIIHLVDHWHAMGMYYENFTRKEIVEEFNTIFKLNIK